MRVQRAVVLAVLDEILLSYPSASTATSVLRYLRLSATTSANVDHFFALRREHSPHSARPSKLHLRNHVLTLSQTKSKNKSRAGVWEGRSYRFHAEHFLSWSFADVRKWP